MYARVSISGVSDTDCNTLIDQAQIFIARDINGIPKRSYVQIAAAFYISTDMCFRMTIAGTGDTLVATDITVSATELQGSTGTAVAAALQVAIRAATGGVGTTVTWTNFFFTITTLLATSQTITKPTGVTHSSAVSSLFGSANATQTGTAWTGGFPRDCTVEASLPSDFHDLKYVSWGEVQLNGAPQSWFARPLAQGAPMNYRVSGDKIYFYSPPATQDVCYIEYMSIPVGGITSDTTAPSLPTRYQELLVYYSAYMLLLATHEFDKASTYLSLYMREKNKLIINRTNQNTAFDDTAPYVPPPFLMSS